MKKIIIEICAGTSCHLMGSFDLVQVVEKLKLQFQEEIEMSFVSCLGSCGTGPNISLNGEIYNYVTPEQLKKLVAELIVERGAENARKKTSE